MKSRPRSLELEVTQANQLVLAGQIMSANEKRLLNLAVSHLDVSEGEMTSRVFVNEFNEQFPGGGNDGYRRIREAASELMKRLVFIDHADGKSWDALHFISSAHYRPGSESEGGAYVDIVFEKGLRSKLVDLKANFHSYELKQISKLESIYAIRLYEILLHSSFGGRKRRIVLEVDQLKRMLRLQYRENGKLINKYPAYKHFRANVLNIAQKQCNASTNLSFEFEGIKQGRSITQISFDVTVTGAAPMNVLPEETLTPTQREATQALREAGYVGDAEKVVLEHGEELVLRTLVMARRIVQEAAGTARPIHNPGGLVQRLLQTGAARDEEALGVRGVGSPRVNVAAAAESLVVALGHSRAEHAGKAWVVLTEDEQAELHDEMRFTLSRFEVDLLDRVSWEGGSYLPLRNQVLFNLHAGLFPNELQSVEAFVEHTGMLEEYEERVRTQIVRSAEEL